MGSCHNSVEMQEPSQPLVEQFSEFLFNHDSEQQQLLPCLDHIMDPAGSGVVPMFQDDNAGFVRSGDVGMEIVSGERGTGLVGGTENLDGLAEDCVISGVCLNESQSGFGDCDVETNGLHFGKIENRGGSMEPGTHNKIVPSVSCGINTKFMPVSGSPRTCAQLDDQKIAKNGMVQQKKSHILGATDSYTFDDRASSPRCRSPEDLIPDNSSLHHAQLDDWKDDETGCVQGIMEERSKSLVAVEADSCNSMVPSSGYKMAQEENQKEFVAHQQIVEEEADHLAASEANPHEALESSLFWQMHEDFSLVSSSAINFGQQDEQKYDKSGCVQVIMEKKSDVLDVLEGVTSDELVSSPGCTSGVLPANDFSRNCVEREKQNYVCTSHGKILDRSVDLLETWIDNDNHNVPSTTSAMLSDLLTVSPSSFLQQDDKRAVECSSQSDNERGDDAKIAYFSERKGDNIISFQGSSRKSKSGRKTLTKQAVRKSRDVAKVPDQHESVEIILKASRRKRSCFSKPARISSWGLLGNITQNFKLSNGLGFVKIKNVDTHNATVTHRREKRKKNGAGGSSQRSNHEHYASTGRIRLKVKLGNQVGQNGMNILVSDPEVLDTSLSADAFITNDGIQSYCGTSSVDKKLCNGVEDEVGEEQNDNHVQSLDNELNKTNSDAPIVHVRLSSKDLQCSVFSEKSAGDAAEDVVPSHIEVEALAVIEKGYSDPGTSPDSEVINLVPDRQAAARSHEDPSSKGFTAPESVIIGAKGKKKNQLLHTGNCFQEDGPPCAEIINKVKPTKKRGARQRKADLFLSSEILTSSASENASTNSWSSKEFSEEHLPSLTEIELETYMNTHTEAKICSALDVGLKLSESQDSTHLIPLAMSKGDQLLRKVDVMQKGQSKVSSSRRSRGGNSYKERGDGWKSISMNEEKGNSSSDDVLCKVEADLTTDDIGKTNSEADITPVDVTNLDIASSGEVDQCLPVDSAWVRCDECHKWRRIAVALVDSIGHTNCQWVCKDNTDEAFAGCSIPQEKSNAEINVELGISDAEEDTYDFASNERGLEYRQTSVCKEYEFTRITTNQFLHRNRRSQTIDEIMVCHCKPPRDGSLGCGDECLNRMLNIECVQGTCPCGDLCSNQQFQKRSYAKMRWGRCGKKGFGLRMEDDIPKGQFLIEYVGEVLDMHTYEARQKEYAFRGHKHFYFMTLDGSEVIDASAKGNLGRFINHSCDPNCRTEKWVVNGEICIGLFALRDIKKGEELTFDYNYVRVVGAAAKKCYCGSPQCRGYIGGDPTSSEVIDQVDSDEEFPEPVMIDDGDGIDNTISETSCFDGDKMKNPTIAVGKLDVPTEAVDSVNQSVSALSQIHGALKMISSNQLIETVPTEEDTSKKPASAVQQEISNEETKGKTLGSFCAEETSPSTVLSKSSDSTVVNRKSKSTTAEDKQVFVKSQFFIKTSRESGCVKKGKVTTRVPIIANKSKLLTTKPKKLVESTSNCRFEAVQEKLNELLDADGGISKRKDSPKGYLKLLLLTAASGASRNGEAIQSNRELSMILDALLKTRSRVVLVDIINKNGLRMLHNILKQYRRDFKKIPILRKLLKVIEYLAVREILTQEHINGGPPCPGMERFTESMLSLTEHDDKQVHQIARSFRDRWIPRHVRRFSYIDREDGRMDFHRSPNYNRSHTLHNQVVRNSEAVDCVMKSKLATSSGDTAISDGSSIPCVGNGTKTRKRKSRWDQPAKENTGNVLVPIDNASKEYSYCRECFRNYSLQDGVGCADIRLNLLEDVPPGFSSPKAASIGNHLADESVPPLKGPIDVVVGLPQTKFISRLPMSYGVPLPIIHKCISPESEDFETWVIAPGMPFHPFPPLPPFPLFPCNRKEAADCVLNPMVINESAEQRALDTHDPATCCPNENNPSTTGASQPETDFPGANDHQTHKRAKGSSYDLGKRYFRQQKWNKVPPWLRSRNGWGDHIGDKSRGEMCSAETGSVSNEHRNSYCSQDLSCRMGNTGGCFNQHAQHLDEN